MVNHSNSGKNLMMNIQVITPEGVPPLVSRRGKEADDDDDHEDIETSVLPPSHVG